MKGFNYTNFHNGSYYQFKNQIRCGANELQKRQKKNILKNTRLYRGATYPKTKQYIII